MDEKKIKDALHKMDIPAHDENAQKRALNLALAEFEATQKKNEKNSQGNSIIARLMTRTKQNKGHKTMETKQKKKLIYGGMATAMAVVLIAGVSFTQLQSGIFEPQADSATAELNAVAFNVDGGNNFGSIAQNTSNPVGRIAENVGNFFKDDSARSRVQPAPDMNQAPSPTPASPAYAPARKEQFAADRAAPQISGIAQKRSAQGMMRNLTPSQIAPPSDVVNPSYQDEGRDQFEEFKINPVKLAAEEPVSTFSVDVDTASYSFMRRQIEHGQMPASDAIRVEELINYFDYNYAGPESKDVPFNANVTVTPSPWADGKELVHIGIKGYEMNAVQPRSNLVFLLDVSGSMNAPDKLPLLKSSLGLLLDTLKPDDTVSIATYAGSTGVALEPTKASEKSKILSALDNLRAGGSTAGAAGIELAYNLAAENFDEEAVNRVILATDGDFNVGINDPEKLKSYIEDKRESGIFLSVLGFGQGNYNDHIMQSLAQNGNGIAAYIDNLNEAQKVLVDEATSSLFPIAKDVKIQVEFNPETVAEYRLIGYETRALNREDFNNDKIDAGDIGAGHTVTAIYEITPVGSEARSIDELRYGEADTTSEEPSDFGGEYAFLKMRYKLPNEDTSKLITTPITAGSDAAISPDVKFSLAVAAFGQILKGGDYTGDYSYDDVLELAQDGKGADPYGYRAEFIKLVRLAKSLDQ